jgi:hypothetical protein
VCFRLNYWGHEGGIPQASQPTCLPFGGLGFSNDGCLPKC